MHENIICKLSVFCQARRLQRASVSIFGKALLLLEGAHLCAFAAGGGGSELQSRSLLPPFCRGKLCCIHCRHSLGCSSKYDAYYELHVLPTLRERAVL